MSFEGFLQTANQQYSNKYRYYNFTDLFSKLHIYCSLHGTYKRIGIYHIYGDECPISQNNRKKLILITLFFAEGL